MAANIDIVFTCFILSSYAISQTFSFLTKPIMLDYTSLLTIDESGKWDISGLDFSDNPNNIKFDQQATLSEEGDVKLWWNFNEENITFKMSARTLGWMGVGIAVNEPGNVVVDYAVMGYKKDNSYLFDMYMNDNGEYILDANQDITQLFIWEEGNVTFAIFSRPLVTCDHPEDNDITSDTFNVVWAFGSEDPQEDIPKKGELIATNSGSIHIKLLNPTVPALGTDLQEFLTYDVRTHNVRVEIGEGHRHCTAFSLPDITSKNHIVQFEPIIENGNEFNVRQITVRECMGEHQGLTSASSSCEVSALVCKTIVMTWSIGMASFTYPKDVGYPIGEEPTYFVMEVRYVNQQVIDLTDSSGLRIYYTSQTRSYDAGVMATGSLVLDSQIIPPRSQNFLLQGHCMNECVKMALPDNGNVTIFAALLHARESGRKVRLRHFRDGEELVPLAEDNSFSYLHQETQFLNREVHLRKGDNMIVECTYDTYERNEITYVNNSHGGESCLAYLSYYPKIALLNACETAPTESVIMSTVGAARPEEMRKSVEQFEWTSQKTKVYNDRVLASQMYVHCGHVMLKDPQPVPTIKKAYVKNNKCKYNIIIEGTSKEPKTYASIAKVTNNTPTVLYKTMERPGNSSTTVLRAHSPLILLLTPLHIWFTYHITVSI